MVRDNDGMKIHVTLPKNFSQKLEDVFNDELLVAAYKWFEGKVEKRYGHDEYEWVHPFPEKQVEIIRSNSFLQLNSKMTQLVKEEWSPEVEKFTIHVVTENPSNKEFFLDGSKSLKGEREQLFARVKGDIIVVDENSENSVSLDEFYEKLLKLIENWLRTAVFYCVGSYV